MSAKAPVSNVNFPTNFCFQLTDPLTVTFIMPIPCLAAAVGKLSLAHTGIREFMEAIQTYVINSGCYLKAEVKPVNIPQELGSFKPPMRDSQKTVVDNVFQLKSTKPDQTFTLIRNN